MKNKRTTKNNRKSKKSRKLNKTKKYRGGEQPFKKRRVQDVQDVQDVQYSYSINGLVNRNIKTTTINGRYTGDWADGKPFKEGKFVSDENIDNFYEGSWEDGKPNGFGEVVIPHSKMYSGEFLNGKIHGTGIMEFFNTGVIIEGSFEECIKNNSPKMCINGVATYPDGSKFIGKFENSEKKEGRSEPSGVDSLANNVNYNIEYGIIHNEDPSSVADLPLL